MPALTLAQAEEQLAEAYSALSAARKMQDYQISTSTGGRRVQRASLADLMKDVQYWQRQVNSLARGGNLRTWDAVPR